MRMSKNIPLLLVIVMFCVICYANGQEADNITSMTHKDDVADVAFDDSLMYKALGDSVCDIILNAKTITATLVNFPDSALIGLQSAEKLNYGQMAVLRFLVTNPMNYRNNSTVFGQFSPTIVFCFIKKKRECKIKFDFGLKKLGVYDSNDSVLKIFDMGSMETLRFSHALFPEVDYFVKLLNYR